MQLQGRDLSIEMRGADVSPPQLELRLLGFETMEEEVLENFLFGESTHEAALKFQSEFDLEQTGVWPPRDPMLGRQR